MRPTQTKPGYWYLPRRGPAICRLPGNPGQLNPQFLEPRYGEYVPFPDESLRLGPRPPAHVRWFGDVAVVLDGDRLYVGCQVYNRRELVGMLKWIANRIGYEFRKVQP